MIPQEKLAAVTRALDEAFGTRELERKAIEDTRIITKGHSGALVYRIVVCGSPFLLRIVTRNPDPTLPQHFASMRIAANAGLAPRLLHSSLEDRLSISDFVETAPLSMPEALARMPSTLRALHALPAFSSREDRLNTTCTYLLNKEVATQGLFERVPANVLPTEQREELFARYEQIVAAYPRQESDRVSSHNDLFKPDNILFDGTRLWLVDWEAAFLNDRYADLAVVANMLVTGEDEEDAFLYRYFGQPANEYQRALFFLMSQLSHIFYAMGFLFISSLSGPIERSEPVPEFNVLRRRIWTNEVNLADRSAKIVYALAHLQQLLENVNRPRFHQSLRMVGGERPR